MALPARAAPARFGKSGTRPLIDRRSGDGTTPAGVFPLGSVTAWDGQTFSLFGNQPNPGTLAAVPLGSQRGLLGCDTEHRPLPTPRQPSPTAAAPTSGCRGSATSTRHAAVIGANLDPISGDAPGETPYAAAIFLHRHSYDAGGATKPTSGCVSLDMEALVDTVRLLDPRLEPHFAIGPTSWLRSSA